MSIDLQKPVIGFSCGDLNGIGIEIIIKALSDTRLTDHCTPVVFASNKSINFYRKMVGDINFSYHSTKDLTKLNPKQVNVFNCWEEEVIINPGQLNETGGKYALISLEMATEALLNKQIHAIVTAPIHKKNIQSESFQYSGHTPYFKDKSKAADVLMFMVAENLRVGLVTEHVPLKDIADVLTKDAIVNKLKMMHQSLRKDFGIDKPQIAVLGLNPHTGDEGLIGNEEITTIKPAITEAKQKHGILAFGPYSADAFFARSSFLQFDAVLAMYHDQGLIPFKSLATGEGVNFSAGLSFVRTSPDHGTAFDIAGKNKANEASLLEATFLAIDIHRRREAYFEMRQNPLKKMSAKILANAVDEKVEATDEE